MFDFKIFLVFALMVNLSWPCLTQKVRKEIICPRYGRVNCRNLGLRNPSIRVVDVIYGRVVGLNECGFTPTVNCTAPAYCEVAEKSNRRAAGSRLYPNKLKRDLCPGKDKYLIIKYKCLDWKDTPLDGKNFALKKPALQSQTLYGRVASNAVDGGTSKKYWLCTRTGKQTSPWWRVDLEQRVNVSHVRILNRENRGLSLCGFQIRIGDSIKNNGTTNARCGTLRHIPSNKDDVISCEPPLVGRYVTIVIPGEDKTLTLCEVEVYRTAVLAVSVTTKFELSNKGCSKTVLYVVISILLVIIAVFVVVVIYLCLRRPKLQPCVKDSVVNVENVTFSDGVYDEVQNPDPDSNHENINSTAYEALDLNKKDQEQNTYQSLVKPTV